MNKDPFQFWNDNGKLVFQREEVRVYAVDGEEYLFVGQIMYASTTEQDWYITNIYPHARGKCLEIGLGLGVASKVILANSDVTHLLTVEKDESVIAALGGFLPRHNILNADVMEWLSGFPGELGPMYDFIFVDHYTFDDEEYAALHRLQTMLKALLKKDGNMVFWIDENAPEGDKEEIKKLWI